MASVAVWLVEALQDLSSYYFIVVSSPDCLPHGQCSSLCKYECFHVLFIILSLSLSPWVIYALEE